MGKPLVLIVDDEPDIRELLAITLSRMELDSRTATDIASAQKLLRGERFELCLTDMNLPDGNGLGLVEWIQANAPAVRFYRANGFAQVGATANCGAARSGIPALVFEKRLA